MIYKEAQKLVQAGEMHLPDGITLEALGSYVKNSPYFGRVHLWLTYAVISRKKHQYISDRQLKEALELPPIGEVEKKIARGKLKPDLNSLRGETEEGKFVRDFLNRSHEIIFGGQGLGNYNPKDMDSLISEHRSLILAKLRELNCRTNGGIFPYGVILKDFEKLFDKNPPFGAADLWATRAVSSSLQSVSDEQLLYALGLIGESKTGNRRTHIAFIPIEEIPEDLVKSTKLAKDVSLEQMERHFLFLIEDGLRDLKQRNPKKYREVEKNWKDAMTIKKYKTPYENTKDMSWQKHLAKLLAKLSHSIDHSIDIPIAQLLRESRFDPYANSGKAYGLWQFTPPTWEDYGEGGDMNNPWDSTRAYIRYAKFINEQENVRGDPQKFLAAYNAGPNSDLESPPFPETRKYIKEIMIGANASAKFRIERSAQCH